MDLIQAGKTQTVLAVKSREYSRSGYMSSSLNLNLGGRGETGIDYCPES